MDGAQKPADKPASSQERLFSEETMQSLRELGAVLRDIHNDLINEGFEFKDGKLIPPPDYEKESRGR